GNDVEAVYRSMMRAGARAREGQGPTLLELETYRFAGHSRSDPGHYRMPEEVAAWKERDPIALYQANLFAEGILDRDSMAVITSEIEKQLDKAVELAEQAERPRPEDCLTDVFVC